MPARLAPPFSPAVAAALDGVTKGREPLCLFTTLARDERLFHRFCAGGLLDRGHLSLRQRETVIDRTTSLCPSEYEWGVHITLFAQAAGLTREPVLATDSACWTDDGRLLSHGELPDERLAHRTGGACRMLPAGAAAPGILTRRSERRHEGPSIGGCRLYRHAP